MVKNNVIYGGKSVDLVSTHLLTDVTGSVPYRNMCRYNSGVGHAWIHHLPTLIFRQFFYRHPLLDKYRYYWRVEYAEPYAVCSTSDSVFL